MKTWKTMGKDIAILCVELRKRMLEYCEREKKKRDLLMMDLVRRCECNLFAVLSLANVSLQGKGNIYLKLPVGLLLRSCFADWPFEDFCAV